MPGASLPVTVSSMDPFNKSLTSLLEKVVTLYWPLFLSTLIWLCASLALDSGLLVWLPIPALRDPATVSLPCLANSWEGQESPRGHNPLLS